MIGIRGVACLMELETKSEKALPVPKEYANNYEEKFNHEHKLLLESEKKFRMIFENSIDGLILWDDQFRITDINCAAEHMLGLTKAQLSGSLLFELPRFNREQRTEITYHINQVMQAGNCQSSFVFEFEDGNKKYFDFSSKRNIYDGMNFTVLQDVSEKAEIQEQLRKSDRLNVIGELAAGIAHEIRNPMTALKGFIQLLEGSIKAEHELYYQVITSELARIDSIINEFLIIAKPQAIRFQDKNVNQIIKETVDLLQAQAVLYNIQFRTQYYENLPELFCEPNQLKKVFINVIKNAIEVMPNGGYISISTNLDTDQIHISIKDQGGGIPEEQLKKLGKPFYTTKERGTGLGLMVSYRIIEEHKGTIQIESEEGRGTTFHINLPLILRNSE